MCGILLEGGGLSERSQYEYHIISVYLPKKSKTLSFKTSALLEQQDNAIGYSKTLYFLVFCTR